MRIYISYGGGVNSTAMIIHMLNIGQDFDEIVFADTGCECPETYEYLEYFGDYLQTKERYIRIITAKGMELEKGDLLAFFQEYALVPSRLFRACTSRFKVNPLHSYYRKPCIQYIGIDAKETHRAKPSKDDDIQSRFPLIEAGITRAGCVDIIKAEGLCVPRKSGCYFCAFARLSHFKDLYKNHSKLFSICLELERKHHEKHNLPGGKCYFIKDKPLAELAKRFEAELDAEEKQELLWDDPWDSMSCLCRY